MTKYRPNTFNEVDPTKLRFTSEPCKYGHAGPDGQGVRYIKEVISNAPCVACKHHLPDGPFTHQFVGCAPPPYKQTPEESRQRHIDQVMAYQKRNPKKHYEITQRYRSKPEIVARDRAKAREAYRQMSPEEKQVFIQKNKAWRDRNKETCKEKYDKRYQDNKEKYRQQRTEARNNRTPEQIELDKIRAHHSYLKRKAKNDAKRQESESQTPSGVGSESTPNTIS